MHQIDEANLDSTDVILGENLVVKPRDLLPHPFNEVWNPEAGK